MGLFKKAKDAAAAAQQGWAAQQQGDGMVHVQGAGPIDPAVMGGPSTRSVAAGDPVLAPINGTSLQDYAELARDAQARGVTDETGMITLAKERGWTRRIRRRRGVAADEGEARRLQLAEAQARYGRRSEGGRRRSLRPGLSGPAPRER